MNISLDPQSIVLTGETGSGKTESAMHLLLFISKSSKVADRVKATNMIFEAFGNARTCHNKNSSRYTKLTEVKFMEIYYRFAHNYFYNVRFEYFRFFSILIKH